MWNKMMYTDRIKFISYEISMLNKNKKLSNFERYRKINRLLSERRHLMFLLKEKYDCSTDDIVNEIKQELVKYIDLYSKCKFYEIKSLFKIKKEIKTLELILESIKRV